MRKFKFALILPMILAIIMVLSLGITFIMNSIAMAYGGNVAIVCLFGFLLVGSFIVGLVIENLED